MRRSRSQSGCRLAPQPRAIQLAVQILAAEVPRRPIAQVHLDIANIRKRRKVRMTRHSFAEKGWLIRNHGGMMAARCSRHDEL
jgi:hypothetical protein